MEEKSTNRKKLVKYKLGWIFTIEEERRMKIAIEEANKFMANYGKGRKPYTIDYEKYNGKLENGNKS